DQRRGGAVDDGRRVAAGLHAAERRLDFCERLDRRGTDVRVGGELFRLALEPDAAGFQPVALEALAHDRRDLAGQEPALLRAKRARKTARREGVDLGPGDLVLAR